MTGIRIVARNIEGIVNSDYVMCVDRDKRTHKVNIHFAGAGNGTLMRKEVDCTAEEAEGILSLFEGAFNADAAAPEA